MRSWFLGPLIFFGALSITYVVATYEPAHHPLKFAPLESDIKLIEPVSISPVQALLPTGPYVPPDGMRHG